MSVNKLGDSCVCPSEYSKVNDLLVGGTAVVAVGLCGYLVGRAVDHMRNYNNMYAATRVDSKIYAMIRVALVCAAVYLAAHAILFTQTGFALALLCIVFPPAGVCVVGTALAVALFLLNKLLKHEGLL